MRIGYLWEAFRIFDLGHATREEGYKQLGGIGEHWEGISIA